MTVDYERPSLLFGGYERFQGFGHILDEAEHIDILRGLFSVCQCSAACLEIGFVRALCRRTYCMGCDAQRMMVAVSWDVHK